MKSSVALFLLLTSLVWGQDFSNSQKLQVATPHITVFQRYSALRQGREQDVLVVICQEEARLLRVPVYDESAKTTRSADKF